MMMVFFEQCCALITIAIHILYASYFFESVDDNLLASVDDNIESRYIPHFALTTAHVTPVRLAATSPDAIMVAFFAYVMNVIFFVTLLQVFITRLV